MIIDIQKKVKKIRLKHFADKYSSHPNKCLIILICNSARIYICYDTNV